MLVLLPTLSNTDTIYQQVEKLYSRIQETEEELYQLPFDKVVENIQKQQYLLFVDIVDNVVISIAIIDFQKYGEYKSLRIMYSAGQITDDWPSFIKYFEDFAKKFNIDYVEVWGRPWLEKVSKSGWFPN